MELKLSNVTKPSKNIAFVFFLFDKDDLAKKSLFKLLSKEEREYLYSIKSGFRVKEKEVKILITPGVGRKVIFVGMGDASQGLTLRRIGLFHRVAVAAAREAKIDEYAFGASPLATAEGTTDAYEVMASNAVMANFEFVKYKTPPADGFSFVKNIEAVSEVADANIKEGLRRGTIIGEETNRCRELSNMPGGDMTPELLAEHARTASRGLGIVVQVLDEKKIKSLGMGGLSGVGKGSDSPPRFIIMEYMHGAKSEKPVVLAGKGVTFDSGGLNIKPTTAIYTMHLDMSGAAAVIHALIAAARLKVKKNIVVLVPAAENMVSGSSYRPGDVLRTMNGKTIEVLNTDAEGRTILSDALEYAKRYNPSLVVDVATLTGSAVTALGPHYSALFTPDKELEESFRKLGDETWDPVWPLPLTAEYEDAIRGTFGDWSNVGNNKGEGGDASNGGVFLWQFTKDAQGKQEYPWVHIDTAPRMTATKGEYLAKGANGTPVRLLVRLLEK